MIHPQLTEALAQARADDLRLARSGTIEAKRATAIAGAGAAGAGAH